MTYMIQQADNVASQLERFTTAYAHHVVGQFANLDFWLGEVNHARRAIDDYEVRFNRMVNHQQEWIDSHDTKVGSFCPQCGGACELEEKLKRPAPPSRFPSSERDQAQSRLKDAAYHFLLRCFRMKLLDEAALRKACDGIGTGVDPTDLKSK